MSYNYCLICGSRLKLRPDKNLTCTKCEFVNYDNPRPTVTALVLYRNKLLLTRRAVSPFKGMWDLPGGFIQGGEDPIQALKRELKEELGVTASATFMTHIPGIASWRDQEFPIVSFLYR